ncbi:hypothetical protein NL676_018330 [Syzygium grande]|nr:hypothetical protein NL676_018330 [Syzygium grande]
MTVSTDLEKRLDEVSLPFLVRHRGEDKVTDKEVSQLLYEVASSEDKTFKLYSGMWHSLLYGEPPSNINIVFADIIGSLDKQTALGSSSIEREQKSAEDDCAVKAK